MTPRVVLDAVSLVYPVYAGNRNLRRRVLRSVVGSRISSGGRGGALPLIHALQDVSLTIEAGDRLGLVGPNGAGKSTLLRVIAGIYEATRGTLRVEGRVCPFFTGVPGLDPEETGRENLITGGLLLGMERKGIEERIARIASESGLDDYVDLPVRTYSTGMQVRLGFALATMMNADILLLDEALVTTDAEFLATMRRRLDARLRPEAIAVIASHDAGLLRSVCTRGVLLKAGRLIATGPIDEILEAHRRDALGLTAPP